MEQLSIALFARPEWDGEFKAFKVNIGKFEATVDLIAQLLNSFCFLDQKMNSSVENAQKFDNYKLNVGSIRCIRHFSQIQLELTLHDQIISSDKDVT